MRKRTIEPLGDLIIVKEDKPQNETSAGGIALAGSVLTEGIVVEVSAELNDLYKKGDRVVFSEGAGNTVIYNSEPHLYLNGKGKPKGDIWSKIKNQ